MVSFLLYTTHDGNVTLDITLKSDFTLSSSRFMLFKL
jgi:hypothetical protein